MAIFPKDRAALRADAAKAAQSWGYGKLLWGGMFVAIGLVGGFAVWAATAKLAGAVVAPGELKVEGQRKTIQHPDGGVIEQILVKNGDSVKEGDVLVRLDGSRHRADLEIIEGQLDELLARQARLSVEMVDGEKFEIPDELAERIKERPQARKMLQGQITLFEARSETIKRKFEQTNGRIEQTKEEITGAEAQIASIDRQLDLINTELAEQKKLLKRGLTQKSRVISLEREQARLSGERGRFVSDIARLKGRISELEINKLELASARREEAIGRLRDLSASVAELRERRETAKTMLSRIELRAPIDGEVLDMSVTTVGGVIRPADPLLHIVPRSDDLVVVARIPTLSRDRLFFNQPTRVLFPSFNQRTTPELKGQVTKIGADSLMDERSGVPYYPVEIAIPESEFARLRESGVSEIVSGLPAEAYIQTEERTAASYFLKPLTDHFERMFKEE